jgi:hypothetical protein
MSHYVKLMRFTSFWSIAKYFGTHAQMIAKPLRWHNTFVLMKVDSIHKAAHNNMVQDALSKQKEFQAKNII